ncbi:MAG: FAD-dependent oxidoreductase [Sphaerochaeta associata]|uniref:FAD-dependent oxidoreductase n=1 Tax=Sphaerochaeta associata TaxID=1129264 RepID=UPI002B205354|nr:FAD-dependent oxidoreductase [Sphaerochaeta associata]MEA5105946.1 FAD-dependent oxidoreductase [Sphaerochaeta associata]
MRETLHYDVAVIGAGASGIAAAISAAKNGAKTILVESSSVFGGDLLSGLPIDGCRTTAGDWIVGGIAKDLFDECNRYNGYIGSIYDRRNICIVMVNPRIMGFSILKKLKEYGVHLLPYSQAVAVNVKDGRITEVEIRNKSNQCNLQASMFIDCTGDGDISYMAGVPYEMGSDDGLLQPMTMVFQIRNINPQEVLQFVLEHPENCGLAENPNSSKTAHELAQELYDLGYPKVFFSSNGPLMKNAIQSGELHSCSMLAFNPNSIDKTVVTVNTTRLVSNDCIGAEELGSSILEFIDQVDDAFSFIVKNIPGCQNAILDGIAPRLGIRESRRILGEYYLTGEEVEQGVKHQDGVCKGGHEIDIHGDKENHYRKTIKDAGSYDIPFGCLIPKGMKNVLMAGRCLSADRIAHSSARVMGTCVAMGQAAGTAAAICIRENNTPTNLSVHELRATLLDQGAIL